MPLPNSRVIPLGWEAHHAPVAEGQMTATCEVRRPSSAATFNETTQGSDYPEPTALYTTRCRAQRLPMRGGDQPIAGRDVVLQRYQVNLPRDVTAPRVNDQIVITECTDPTLTGLILRIREVRSGTLRWQRDLMCEEVTPMTR